MTDAATTSARLRRPCARARRGWRPHAPGALHVGLLGRLQRPWSSRRISGHSARWGCWSARSRLSNAQRERGLQTSQREGQRGSSRSSHPPGTCRSRSRCHHHRRKQPGSVASPRAQHVVANILMTKAMKSTADTISRWMKSRPTTNSRMPTTTSTIGRAYPMAGTIASGAAGRRDTARDARLGLGQLQQPGNDPDTPDDEPRRQPDPAHGSHAGGRGGQRTATE